MQIRVWHVGAAILAASLGSWWLIVKAVDFAVGGIFQ